MVHKQFVILLIKLRADMLVPLLCIGQERALDRFEGRCVERHSGPLNCR